MTQDEARAKSAALKADYEASEAMKLAIGQDSEIKRRAWLEWDQRYVLRGCSTFYAHHQKYCSNIAEAGSSMCAECREDARMFSYANQQDREIIERA